ncbi:MAG: hypothetical protein ABI629_01630 [bacterium]
MTCVDLAARFGAVYRLGWEPDGAALASTPRDDWPWLRRVRCRYGVVYPIGADILAAWTDRRRVGAQLRALPLVLTSRGDLETVVRFHVDDAEPVLEILRAYRRRRPSDAERDRLRRIGSRKRLQCLDGFANAGYIAKIEGGERIASSLPALERIARALGLRLVVELRAARRAPKE